MTTMTTRYMKSMAAGCTLSIGCVICMSWHILVSSHCVSPGEKQSGERSRISWAYSSKVVRTNEIMRSVIVT